MQGGGLIWLISTILTIIPLWMLWKRTGHSPYWALTAVIPLAGLVQIWVLAFKTWPAADTKGM